MSDTSASSSRSSPEGRGSVDPDSSRPSHRRRQRGLAVGVRIVLIVGMLVVAGGVFGLLKATRKQSGMRGEPAPPITIRAIEATPRRVDRVWEGFGTVRSMARAQVAAEVSGRVVERPTDAEPGRSIARGGLILRIDPTDYEIALARAEQALAATRSQVDGLMVESERVGNQVRLARQELEAAERDLDRVMQAAERGAGTQGEIDSRITAVLRIMREINSLEQQADLIPSRRQALEAQIVSQQAEIHLAAQNRERTRVVSPIGGEIQGVSVRAGDYVNAGTTVAEVVDLARLEVPLRLPASSASWVARIVGVPDTVSLWDGPVTGEPDRTGTVTRLAPEADPASRTITVFVEVRQDPSSTERLLPGSFVQGRVRTPDPDLRVLLPRRAIRSGRVMLVQTEPDGTRRITAHPVATGYSLDARLPEVDPNETEWVALALGAEPPAGALVAVTALGQLEQGVRVLLSDDAAGPDGDRP